MTVETLLLRLKQCPLIASVQASEGPVDHPDTLLRLARASGQEGVKVLRVQGVKNMRTIKPAIPIPTIGLIKRPYQDSDVYITPTAQDVDSVRQLRCEIVAIDGTDRPRPKGATLEQIIKHVQFRKGLALADCDTVENAIAAEKAGADLISTTLAGYTPARKATDGPDLEVLRQICNAVKIPVLAEGRYTQRWQVEAALKIGAVGVVVGGALNDPVKQTRALMPRFGRNKGEPRKVGAVDIGGTWLRFGVFSEDWQLVKSERVANPKTRKERLDWIREQIVAEEVDSVGIGTGGIVDPATGEVWTAKEYLMPDQIGIVFDAEAMGVPTFAHGDGHAAAWGHACLSQFAAKRVATLSLGTGVGCGFVQNDQIWCGRRGEYPRINDLPTAGGKTYEDLLGGMNLTKEPTDAQRASAVEALEGAVKALQDLYFPDEIVVCGSVGLSPWLAPHLERLETVPTPFGSDAGLYGAAALALFPS